MNKLEKDSFCSATETGINKTTKMVCLIEDCSGIAYRHAADQVQQIFEIFQAKLDSAKRRFTTPVKENIHTGLQHAMNAMQNHFKNKEVLINGKI